LDGLIYGRRVLRVNANQPGLRGMALKFLEHAKMKMVRKKVQSMSIVDHPLKAQTKLTSSRTCIDAVSPIRISDEQGKR